MAVNPVSRGNAGEAVALQYYSRNGYRLLERNYRTRVGEIDLILQKNRLLVFAEVKARAAGAMVSPAQSVTPGKRRRIIRAAQVYLATHNISEPQMRFDVVEVEFGGGGGARINCIENAFEVQR